MKIRILGTGGSAGVPSIGGPDGAGDWGECDPAERRNTRTRSSIVIESDPSADGHKTRILIDTGPDMRAQLLAQKIPAIDAFVFTHAHADHVTGLDDVRLLNRIANTPLPAFAMPETFDELERRFDYAFRPWTGGNFYRPVLDLTRIDPGDTIAHGALALTTFEQDHHVMRTLGLRCGNFAYSTDAVRLDDAAMTALRGTDTWLVGCFQRDKHLTHAHIALVDQWRTTLAIRRTILTHMGNDMDWSWMRTHLPAGMEAAFDGMVVETDG